MSHTSFTLPYVCCTLNPPHTQSLLSKLTLPSSVLQGIQKAFSPGSLLIARSSANVEDLAGVTVFVSWSWCGWWSGVWCGVTSCQGLLEIVFLCSLLTTCSMFQSHKAHPCLRNSLITTTTTTTPHACIFQMQACLVLACTSPSPTCLLTGLRMCQQQWRLCGPHSSHAGQYSAAGQQVSSWWHGCV